MSGYAKEVTVLFEMKDGRELTCQYSYSVTYGNISGPPEHCYPDECEVGEPTYYLDGHEISVERLPKGLDVIAKAMYEGDKFDARFSYAESTIELNDSESEQWDERDEWDDY